eukprot:9312-Heterococcus_DN1.PRE.2
MMLRRFGADCCFSSVVLSATIPLTDGYAPSDDDDDIRGSPLLLYARAILNLLDVVLCDNDSTGNATTLIRSENNHTTSNSHSYALSLSYDNETTSLLFLTLQQQQQLPICCCVLVSTVASMQQFRNGLLVEVKKSAVVAAVASSCVSGSNCCLMWYQ